MTKWPARNPHDQKMKLGSSQNVTILKLAKIVELYSKDS